MIIITSNYGQLGNRLQLFAHFIAFAIEHNQRVVNLGFSEYAHLFEHTSQGLYCRYPPKKSFFTGNKYAREYVCKLIRLLLSNPPVCNIDSRLLKTIISDSEDSEFRLDHPEFLRAIGKKQIVLARGYYFVDYINLLKHADKVRQYFTPLHLHQLVINDLIKKARESCEILVGVHIRHGDYKNYLGGKFYFEIDDYKNIMKKAKNLFKDRKVGFLICSDTDLERKRFSDSTVTFGTDHIIEDMYLLAKCDFIIGVPSTYSRWACFYGNVPTYYIRELETDFSLDHFYLYEDMAHRHMQHAPQFPRFA